MATKAKCYHCGENCEGSNLHIEEKPFCCIGCKTVYQLLEENDLCNYYSLEQTPGNQLKDFFSEKFNFLENQDIADKLLDFKSDKFHKITFKIPSIHCSSCIWLLENLIRFDEGVIQSRIQFSSKKLTVDYNPNNTTIKKIADLLYQLGYEPEITLQEHKSEALNTDKHTFMKLGISGFAFGNIMLFAFPDYLGIPVGSEFTPYFTYLSLALSLPVLFYCASEFFISAFLGLRKKVLNIDLPIAVGILALFFRSLYEITTASGPGYLDSMAALVFFLLIGRWFQSKTYEKLSFDRNYKSYFPLAVYQISKGQKTSVLVEDLVVGDKIEIRNDEIIPCDAILNSDTTKIDYSFVTGESNPVTIYGGEKVYAGGRIKGLAVELSVLENVSQSYLTQLWNSDVFESENKKEELSLIDKVSQYFTPAILLIAISAMIYWSFVDSSKMIDVFSSVLIIACPCALALTSPFTLGSTINALGQHNFYLKNTLAIEKLWNIKHIVFDKTGTITNSDLSQIHFEGTRLNKLQLDIIKSLTKHSTHPLSQSINQFVNGTGKLDIQDYTEEKGKGISSNLDGVLYKLGSASWVDTLASDDKTGSRVYFSVSDEVLGYFSIHNSYRKGLKEMIDRLAPLFNFSILSGDNDQEKSRLTDLFPENTDMHFNQSPPEKLAKIKEIEQNENSIMFGDGLNDAGALKASSIGISISNNLSAFTPASDAILLGKKLTQFPAFLGLIKQSKKVIIAGFIISFLYNAIGLSFAVAGLLTPVFAAILMPISSISVVVFSTLSIRFLSKRIY